MSVYIDIGIWRETGTLNSKRSHTFILIHNNTHIHERGKPGSCLLEANVPYTNMNINIHARRIFNGA